MKKKTNKEFLLELSKLNPTYDVLSEYVNIDTKVHCYCRIHNVYFNSKPYDLLHGKCGCELCRKEKISKAKRRSYEEFVKLLYLVNDKIRVVGEYKGSDKNIECECLEHHILFNGKPHKLLQGQTGCYMCISQKNHESGLKSHEEFIKQVSEIHPFIDIIGKYNGAKERIKVRCKICGTEWEPVAGSLIQGYGCPHCNLSKGEKTIDKWLHNKKILYNHQYIFEDLRGYNDKSPLRFDFYLPDYDLLIEYQGQFHDGSSGLQTEENYLRQQSNDEKKRTYVKYHNYNLLEIWYWDFDNISTILESYINNLESSVETTAI